jgi:DNA-binding NarL/FixJ family response regulator
VGLKTELHFSGKRKPLMKRTQEKPTILIIDDDEGIRDTVEAILKHKYHIIKAENGEEGLEIIKRRKIHLALIDIKLPGISGMDVLEIIQERRPDICCLMISMVKDIPIVVDCMRMGALDYIEKEFDYDTLNRRVEIALKLCFLQREIQDKDSQIKELKTQLSTFYSKRRKSKLRRLKEYLTKSEPASLILPKAARKRNGAALAESPESGLTKREIEVLKLLENHPFLSNKEIADRMNISLSTVKTHLSNVFLKLGISCRCQAVVTAKEKGLL